MNVEPSQHLRIPAGACDTHAHVIGRPDERPFVADRSYTPRPAPAESYLAVHEAFGIERGVLVQVSVHGTDNSLMCETLQAHRDRLRGVAVVPAGIADEELDRLEAAGVKGVRINLVTRGGGNSLDDLERLAERVAPRGWHVQVYLDGEHLLLLERRLPALATPLVVDHMGNIPASRGINAPEFTALLRMLEGGRCWVKLSGAYRTSVLGPPFTDTIPFARALVAAAPERCVWGSDWPHVQFDERGWSTFDLVQLLQDWIPDEHLRRRILVENAAQLYGF